MDTLEKIKNLCKQKGITVQQLEKDIGERPTAIAKISSNSKAEKLDKIAKYFDVTIEYLIRSDEAQSVIDRITDWHKAMTTKDPDLYLYEKYRRDPEFMEYISLLFYLPPNRKQFVYDTIRSQSNYSKEDKEKEGINSNLSEVI